MPEKDCVKVGETVYCWNKETKKIDVYTRKTISVEECSPAIVSLLMDLLSEKQKDI